MRLAIYVIIYQGIEWQAIPYPPPPPVPLLTSKQEARDTHSLVQECENVIQGWIH